MYIYDINHETNDTYDIKDIRFKGPEINYFYKYSDIYSDICGILLLVRGVI